MNGRKLLVVLLLLCLAVAGIVVAQRSAQSPPARTLRIGLFGTLPLLWGESDRVADLLAHPPSRHWAVAVMEETGAVVPVDAVTGQALDRVDILVMAQPRPLAPEENVALDRFARHGRVLLLADPMLTAPSAFPLGDKRRPQDTVLLSTILARWGLALQFDESQSAEERWVSADGTLVPVRLAGRWAGTPGNACRFSTESLIARCRGQDGGQLVAVADAALLEDGPSPERRTDALRGLMRSVSGGIAN